MTLFFISLFLTALTGFFISAIFEQKNFIKILIYFLTTMFASVVLNVEILSLFSKISANGILLLNIITAIITGIIWFKKGHPIFHVKFRRFFKRLYYALYSDKYLLVLGISFLFMCGISLFLISFMPVVNPDAEAYHVLRSLFWLDNGNLNHFVIADIRNLPMPINSEILYLWIMAFMKKQVWLGIFPFVGFIMALTSLYGIMSNIKVSERHKWWVIFIIASLPSVIVQISGTETDIIISGLVLASIYLYWNYFKDNKISGLFFASLAYALAIGTKTTSLMMVLPVGLWMVWLGYHYLKKDCYKPFLKFLGFGVINFVIFASYNYVLNFLDFGNIFGPQVFLNIHRNLYGIKGLIAGFIKHFFLFFDFTGFIWNKVLGSYILKLKAVILSLIGLGYIPDGYNSSAEELLNNSLIEPNMGMGILGIILFLPVWIWSLIKFPFNKDFKNKIITSFGLILLLTLIVMSYQIVFMTFSIRFLTSFCVICAPVLLYSYNRKNNIFKFIFTIFALFGLLLISTHLWARPYKKICNYFKHGYTVSQVREIASCARFLSNVPKYADYVQINEMCQVRDTIKTYDKSKKILYFPYTSENLLLIKNLMFEGYNIDFALLEDADKIKFENYDLIISLNFFQAATNILHYNKMPKYNPIENVECTYYSLDKTTVHPAEENDYIGHIGCQLYPQLFEDKGFIGDRALKISEKEGTLYYLFYIKK